MARTTSSGKNKERTPNPLPDLDESGDDGYLDASDVEEQPSTSIQLKKSTTTSRPKSKQAAREKPPSNAIVVDEDDEDGTEIAEAPRTTKNPSHSVNGKGKGKAPPAKRPRANESVDDDVVEVEDSLQAIKKPPSTAGARRVPSSSQKKPQTNGKVVAETAERMIARLENELERNRIQSERALSKLEKENERLKAENEALREERDTFSKQFSDLSKLRTTDYEEAYEELREVTSAQADAQEALINTLTAEISGMEELSRNGHTHGLKLLTREATDAKLREMKANLVGKEDEVKRLTEQTTELKEQVETLKFDLAQEKEHLAQELARVTTRQPPVASSSPARASGPANRIMAAKTTNDKELIRLFEDICGLVVLNVASEPRDAAVGGGVIWKFRCLFTVNNADSLTFEFTAYPLQSSTTPAGEQEIMYTPLLDMEPRPSSAFLDRLGWLTNTFTFERSQLSSWFRTLAKLVDPPDEEDGEEQSSEDDDVMEVE